MVNIWFEGTSASVDGHAFLAAIWVSSSIALLSVSLHVFARLHYSRRLYPDDLLLLAAWAALLVQSIIWTIWSNTLYKGIAVATGLLTEDNALRSASTEFLRGLAVARCMYFLCLFTVKLSLLVFFRRNAIWTETWTLRKKFFWWGIVSLVVSGVVTCLGDQQLQCIVDGKLWTTVQCSGSRAITPKQISILNCCLDTTSTLLILIFPIPRLWAIHTSTRRKYILLGLLGAGALAIALAVIRIATPNLSHSATDIPWLWTWGLLECAFAILLASIASFHKLYAPTITVEPGRRRGRTNTDLSTWYSTGKTTSRSFSPDPDGFYNLPKYIDPASLPPNAFGFKKAPSISHYHPSPPRELQHGGQQHDLALYHDNTSSPQQPNMHQFTSPQHNTYKNPTQTKSHPSPSPLQPTSHLTSTYPCPGSDTTDVENASTLSPGSIINLSEVPLYINPSADRSNDIFANRAPMPQFLSETYASWGVGPSVRPVPRT